jgi:catechol 2,3-dioxygenase-like lactoylglutathione lyase family enzyme
MKVLFIGSVGMIVRDRAEGRKFFVDALGLPLKQAEGNDFLFSDKLQGSKYFGVWPLSGAARACFGVDIWPMDHPIPQMFVEFEVDKAESVASAAEELESKGYTLLHAPRKDPWGQTVTRLQTKDGVVIGISYVPWMHRAAKRKVKRVRVSRR